MCAFCQQNSGDYTIPELTLKPDIGPELTGFAAQIK